MKFVKHFLFSLGLTLASVDYVFEDHRGEEHTLKHLTVTGYKYISINSEILKNFINLEQISIRGTSIRVLPEGLKNLKKLKRFEFRNNNAAIELLNFDILKDLPDLRKIEIACNRRDLTGCKETESGEKVGTPFPISVCNCMQITHLLVNHNSIFEIPNEIVNLKNLFELDLSDNQIENINPRLLELTDLSKLFLGNNLVTVFPSFLLIMKNLKFLNLENNLIGYNDPMILNFKTVHNGLSLILRNNLILKNSIDTNLGLDRLKELNLKDIDLSLQSDFKDIVTENCKKDPHWNLFELSKIDLNEDMKILENTISDRSFKRMWIEVIRHLIFDDCNDNGVDWTSNEKGVLLYNTDKLIDKTTKSRIFKIIKSMKKDVTEIDKID